MHDYKTIAGTATGELTEKRSRFICMLIPVTSEEEAIQAIARVRERHHAARHNVYAYRLRGNGLERYSDDGEPQKTAGLPMLDVLKGAELQDICAVVTRYFGGTLLGTGGLVRAYSGAVQQALQNATVVKHTAAACFIVTISYKQHKKALQVIQKMGGLVENTSFTNAIDLFVKIPYNCSVPFRSTLVSALDGAVQIDEQPPGFMA